MYIMKKSALNNLEKYPKNLGKHTLNTPKKWGNTPKIWGNIPLIPQKFGEARFINICNSDIYKPQKSLEIIYIILSNKLSNYRNIETAAQNFWILGSVSLLKDNREEKGFYERLRNCYRYASYKDTELIYSTTTTLVSPKG